MYDELFPILATNDMAAALRFYRDQLGGSVTYQFPPEGEADYLAVMVGRSRLGLGRAEQPVTTNDRITLWAYADDCDVAFGRMREAGVEVVQEPTDQPWGERMGMVLDPDGNRVIIASRAPS